MLLAATLELDDTLDRLSAIRPVFHSEADFKHAFAWEVARMAPSLEVRLEVRTAPGVYLDVLLVSGDGVARTAIELKYPTALWTGNVGGEPFALKNHGAQDILGYSILKDVQRIEEFVARTPGSNGALVCITNETYWKPPASLRPTNAAAFRLYDGTTIAGVRSWGPDTGQGTMAGGRDKPLSLRGTHQVAWRSYSEQPGKKGTFKRLVIPVSPATT